MKVIQTYSADIGMEMELEKHNYEENTLDVRKYIENNKEQNIRANKKEWVEKQLHEQYPRAVQEHLRAKDQTYGWLRKEELKVNDANVELTATCGIPKETWDKLLSVYEQSSGQRVDRLKKQFFTMEKSLSKDVATHIARLQKTFHELNDELRRIAKTKLPDLLLFVITHGIINVDMFIRGKWMKNHLKNVWCVPDIGRNLFSVGQTIEKEYHFKADQDGCSLLKDSIVKVAGEPIHGDVCRPMQKDSVGGGRYFLCLKNDYSRYRRVLFLNSKAEVVNCLKTFLNEADAAGHTIKEFLCDGSREFNNKDVRSVLESKGTNLRVVMPYTPEQNDCVERENCTLVESARTMIHAKKLPIKLWSEAINTATYVINRTGPSTVKDKTPIKM
ncbi:hypothetical protein ILUMI_21493 [Ignelater luminosus]|uniref:Integrase catalytic domain-containing protein n=1 Tax=Ignelater luminosus TaxID=2038154 RepID=A0A8K0CGC4_IGNLU|nr:hypothetical protein ILUMI_21493 [Ignelater luminosus]